jgi:hypothetical protein
VITYFLAAGFGLTPTFVQRVGSRGNITERTLGGKHAPGRKAKAKAVE